MSVQLPSRIMSSVSNLQVVAGRPRRRRPGKLREMLDLPMELLEQVLQFLSPRDLLQLARASKQLHGFLMSESSTHLWEQARRNIDKLPPCPDDMTEPGYASLVFGHRCQVCGRANVRTTFWNVRVRCCNACIPKLFVKVRECSMKMPWRMSQYLPKVQHGKSPWYYRPLVEFYEAEYQQLDPQDAKSIEQWEDKMSFASTMRRSFETALSAFEQAYADARKAELEEVRKSRRENVLRRLIAEGWECALAERRILESVLKHKKANLSRALNDKGWENISQEMIQFIRRQCDLKTEELLLDLQDFYCDKYKVAHLPFVQPSIADFAMFPPVYNLLKNPAVIATGKHRRLEHHHGFSTTHSVDIPVSPCLHLWQALNSQFAEFELNFQRRKDEELKEIIRECFQGNVLEDLGRAVVFFKCQLCSQDIIQHPRILAHQCLSALPREHQRSHFQTASSSGDEEELQKVFNVLQQKPWDCRQVVFNYTAYRAAWYIIRAAGFLDPDRVSAQEMHRSPYLFECRRCRTTKGRLLMRFLPAVRHALLHTPENSYEDWEWLDLSTAPCKERIARAEARSLKKALKNWDKRDFTCVHCKFRGRIKEVYGHIKMVYVSALSFNFLWLIHVEGADTVMDQITPNRGETTRSSPRSSTLTSILLL
ncbi:hypothetical protein AX16_002927 [Volvariella volvacea WC 439]|nr:hypothetical protein AX16_002927 [Volvariella volvacea WC 439]